jgi:heme oxygenase (biliverdin-producing, ferredoxin)
MLSVPPLATRPQSAPVTAARHPTAAVRRFSLEAPRDVVLERGPLSQVMFQAVASKHMAIARHPFFVAMDDGTLSRDAYVRYLSDRLVLCTALEEALKKLQPRMGAIASLHFNRREAVIEDLTALRTFPTEPSAAVSELEALINEASASEVVAHAWVEYMGMLNGGQGMKLKLRKLFGTAAFVTFPEKAKVLRERYTRTLDALHVAQFERQSMCEEASAAFDLHTAVLDANMNPPPCVDSDDEDAHVAEGPSLWQTWRSAFAWVPRLFGAH